VGLDGYNFGDNHDKYQKWKSYDEVFGPSIDAISRLSKPIMLTEIGCADDSRKAAWMSNFLERVTVDRRIQAFIYFNYDKRKEKEPNWRIDSDPESLKAFQNWAKGHR
jgi:beta-mannanase